MATRNLATGILDIQLMGLPDVKRQLEGIPRLMDGVADAALTVRDRLNAAFAEVNTQHIATKMDMVRKGLDPSLMKAPDQSQFTKEFFRKGMDQSFEHSREAITGTQSLEYLATEKQIVNEIEQELKAKGELDAVNQHILATERERIRLSEQSIHLERQRVMDPARFQKEADKQAAAIDIRERGGDFQEQATQKKATEQLEAKKRALLEYKQTQEAATETGRAYAQRLDREIEFEGRAIQLKKQIGAELIRVANQRDELAAKQARGVVLTTEEAKVLSGLNRQFEELSVAMQNADRQSGRFKANVQSFNSQLKAFGDNSRRANYRAQQLSFAAQDMVQVWGQTGFAGALHASANNLSMFVQTLDYANPKLLAWGAFGVTAGMMALNAWLKNTKEQTEELTNAITALKDETKELVALSNVTASSGNVRDAQAGLRQQEEESRLRNRGVEQEMSLLATRLTSEAIGKWDQFTMRILTSSEHLYQEAERARQQFMAGQIPASELLKVYEKADLLTDKQKEAFHSSSKDAGTIAAELGRAREAARLAAVESIRLGEGQFFQNSSQSFMSTMEGLQPARRPGANTELQRLLAQGREQQRIRDISSAVDSFSPEILTEAESRTKDYSGAISRLRDEHAKGLVSLRQSNATQSAIAEWNKKFAWAIQDAEDGLKNYRRSLDDAATKVNRYLAGDATGMQKISRQESDRANQMMRQVEDDDRLSQRQKEELLFKIRQEAANRIADASSELSVNLWDQADQESYWNDEFARRRLAIRKAYRDRVDQIRDSGVDEKDAIGLMRSAKQTRDEKLGALSDDEKRAILDAKFMGRDGAGDPMVQAQIEETKRAADALLAIEQSTLLSAQEKKGRAAIAQEVHKDNMAGIQDRFKKIGFSDPKSLHRQIQMSLQRPRSEKIMTDQLKQQEEMNKHLKAIESKPIFGIGP